MELDWPNWQGTLISAQSRWRNLSLTPEVSLHNRFEALGLEKAHCMGSGQDQGKNLWKLILNGDFSLDGTKAPICHLENISKEVYCFPEAHIHNITKRLRDFSSPCSPPPFDMRTQDEGWELIGWVMGYTDDARNQKCFRWFLFPSILLKSDLQKIFPLLNNFIHSLPLSKSFSTHHCLLPNLAVWSNHSRELTFSTVNWKVDENIHFTGT